MVTQPAYILNLKNYAKARYGDSDAAKESAADLTSESDRGAIILASTSIEDMLEYEILKRLPGLKDDDSTRKRLFENDGLIASFSKKTEMAYALGIIDKDYKKKIDLIREIRNACAHSRLPLSMDKKVLRDACERAIIDMLPSLTNKESPTIRRAFVVKCMLICHYIISGEKLEGPEAQLRHYARLLEDEKQP